LSFGISSPFKVMRCREDLGTQSLPDAVTYLLHYQQQNMTANMYAHAALFVYVALALCSRLRAVARLALLSCLAPIGRSWIVQLLKLSRHSVHPIRNVGFMLCF